MTNKAQSISGLDYWRLSDEFSVVDAAFLTLNLDPGDFVLQSPSSPATSTIHKIGGLENWEARAIYNGDTEKIELEPNQFRAVFKALRNGVMSNKIRAKIVKYGRRPLFEHFGDSSYETGEYANEETVSYDFIVSRGVPTLFSSASELHDVSGLANEARRLYVLEEPSWQDTTIEMDELRRWYTSRGIAPAFFFPDGAIDGFRNKSNARYSAKLATAIAAWEAVVSPYRNKSVKQSVTEWIVSNGVQFGLGNKEGVVSLTVAEEVAKVVNWKTTGGANPTSSEGTEETEPNQEEIENFDRVLRDDEIPF